MLSGKQSGLTTKNRNPASLSREDAGDGTFPLEPSRPWSLKMCPAQHALADPRPTRPRAAGEDPTLHCLVLAPGSSSSDHSRNQEGARRSPSSPLATHSLVQADNSPPLTCPHVPWAPSHPQPLHILSALMPQSLSVWLGPIGNDFRSFPDVLSILVLTFQQQADTWSDVLTNK